MARTPGRPGGHSGEVAFVTGASRGIGLEVCRRLTSAGVRVGMIARDPEALEAARREVRGTVCAAPADVSDAAGLAAALSHLESVLGPPTILVNNAGHGHWGAAVDTDVEVFRRAIEVNYLGAVHATSHVLPDMLRQGRGSIVNVSSIAGRIAAPFEAAYSASKFALVGYSEALAVEIAGSGVSVAMVHPGPVDTGFFERRGHPYRRGRPRPLPVGRVAEEVVAAAQGGRAERFLPRWLGFAHVVKTVAPVTHRVATRRLFAEERRTTRARHRA